MKISVCMATYNGEKYLPEQIESIVSQLQAGDEIVVADDGSSDGTLAFLARHQGCVRVVATSRVGGVVRNFERALQAASGDIVVLCDQDDVWLPGRLDLIRRELQDCDLLVMNAEVVDGELKSRQLTVNHSVGVRKGFLRNLAKNSFVGCCMAFRREVLRLALPFPRGIPWHDWYIGLIAELYFRVRRVDTVTLLYRRHGANFSPTGEQSTNSLGRRLGMRVAILRAVGVAGWRRFSVSRLNG